MTKSKKHYASYTKLTKGELDRIEHSKYFYAVFVSPHPLAELFDEDMLEAMQILIRPVGIASRATH